MLGYLLCRPGNCPDRNGNVGGYFCPSRLNHYCRGHRPQTESVLLNAWKGKNTPPLVPNVPVRPATGGSAVGIPVPHFHIKTATDRPDYYSSLPLQRLKIVLYRLRGSAVDTAEVS